MLCGTFMLSALALSAPIRGQTQSLIAADVLTLDNGMKAIFHVDRRQPNVAVMAQLNIGARHETPGRTGLAHLFEHLYFNGSEHPPRAGICKRLACCK